MCQEYGASPNQLMYQTDSGSDDEEDESESMSEAETVADTTEH